jgi:hypothetical protein
MNFFVAKRKKLVYNGIGAAGQRFAAYFALHFPREKRQQEVTQYEKESV